MKQQRPRSRKVGIDIQIERAVVAQRLDPAMNDWVLTLECGHVVRISNRFGSVKFTKHWCTLCGMIV